MTRRISLSWLLGLLLFLPAFSHADEGNPLSLTIPEQMVNDTLKGQSFSGEDSYPTAIGEVPYTWKLSEMTFSFQDGYADIKATAEISAKGYSYKEPVTGKLSLKLQVRSQKIQAKLEHLTVPIYASVLGTRKKIGEVDLATVIGPQEESIEPYLSKAAPFLPKGTTLSAKSLGISVGSIKAEVVVKTSAPPAETPK